MPTKFPGPWLTIILGLCFTSIQGWEYYHAPFAFSNSIYGATFFMATGFHGAHVIIGTIFLIVCLLRAELSSALHDAGFGAVRWLMPAESGFYQPLVLATKERESLPAPG